MIHHNFPSDSHPGNMPIRVFQNSIFKHVENIGELTPEKHKKYVNSGKISDCIEYSVSKEKLLMPCIRVSSRQICLQETFLGYLWAFCYFFLVINEEGIKQHNNVEQYKIIEFNTPTLQKALKLLNWAISLKNKFSDWPLDLPNPEHYEESDQFYIEKVNAIFLDAITFCFLHELSHAINGHLDNARTRGKVSDADNIDKEMENEADNYAISLMLNNTYDEIHKLRIGYACTLAMCACLPLTSKKKLASSTHPDIDTRIVNLIDKFGVENPNHMLLFKSTLLNTFIVFRNIHELSISTDLDKNIDELIDHFLYEFEELKN